jgi:hypothetical protein
MVSKFEDKMIGDGLWIHVFNNIVGYIMLMLGINLTNVFHRSICDSKISLVKMEPTRSFG